MPVTVSMASSQPGFAGMAAFCFNKKGEQIRELKTQAFKATTEEKWTRLRTTFAELENALYWDRRRLACLVR